MPILTIKRRKLKCPISFSQSYIPFLYHSTVFSEYTRSSSYSFDWGDNPRGGGDARTEKNPLFAVKNGAKTNWIRISTLQRFRIFNSLNFEPELRGFTFFVKMLMFLRKHHPCKLEYLQICLSPILDDARDIVTPSLVSVFTFSSDIS